VAELAPQVRAVPGKLVVSVMPLASPHKGDALGRIRRVERANGILYVGDDITDEDVFRLNQSGLIPVRVGRSRYSAAPYYIRSQIDIDRLLTRLIDLRR
jgi:trehalose 6-phosphate phosphatase